MHNEYKAARKFYRGGKISKSRFSTCFSSLVAYLDSRAICLQSLSRDNLFFIPLLMHAFFTHMLIARVPFCDVMRTAMVVAQRKPTIVEIIL